MRRSRSLNVWLLLSYISLLDSARAVNYDNDLSFGHVTPITHDIHRIPHFQIVGDPRIFTDRVLLTPPAPGSQRSAIWAEKGNSHPEWQLEVPFRASGPERAGGSFHIWYTQKGSEQGAGTVYNSKPFDGLALVVDSFGGRGGSLRGFLNDGTTDYSLHHNPQSLSFGHCDLAYRNLGVITTLKVSYSKSNGLKVETDGRTCFETNKVKLPEGYKFGVSAASADTPDSFEIFGFKVSSDHIAKHYEPVHGHQAAAKDEHKNQGQQQQQQPHHDKPPEQKGDQKFEYKDASVNTFKNQDQQFKDLHERLQGLTHQIAELQKIGGTLMWKLDQMTTDLDNLRSNDPHHAIELLEHKIGSLDQSIQTVERTLHEQHSVIVPKVDDLHNAVSDHTVHMYKAMPDSLKEALQHHGPRVGTGVSILIVFQVALAIAYVIYKRRRSQAPKKYL